MKKAITERNEVQCKKGEMGNGGKGGARQSKGAGPNKIDWGRVTKVLVTGHEFVLPPKWVVRMVIKGDATRSGNTRAFFFKALRRACYGVRHGFSGACRGDILTSEWAKSGEWARH